MVEIEVKTPFTYAKFQSFQTKAGNFIVRRLDKDYSKLDIECLPHHKTIEDLYRFVIKWAKRFVNNASGRKVKIKKEGSETQNFYNLEVY